MTDSDQLRQYIAEAGLTQEGAAAQIGISPRAMRKYCSGRYPIPGPVMIAMEHIARCRPLTAPRTPPAT